MWEKLFLFTVIIWMVSPAHSAVLECQWNPEMTYCNPFNITPVTQPDEVITINGKPSNYVNPNTTHAFFVNQTINYMPNGLFTLFPKLQSLNLYKFDATSLTTDSIPKCGELNQFIARGGQFTNIPAGVLESCKSLTVLGFADNNVTTIDVDAFRGLANLTHLDQTNGKVTCIPLGLFQHNPLLTRINFYQNLIKTIDSSLFTNLPMLSTVNLANNLISFIPMLNLTTAAITSSNPSPMTSILFSSNPIYAIAPDICSIFGGWKENFLDFYIFNISCIPINPQFYSIKSSTCQNYSTALQNCFANWTTAMNAPVPSGQQTTLAPTTSTTVTVTSTTVPSTTTTVPPTTAINTTPSATPDTCPSDRICRYFLDQYNRYTCILDGVDSVLTSISGNHLITFADVNVRRVIFTNSFLSRIPPILFQKFPSLEYLTVSNCSMSALNTNTFAACGTLKYFDASNNFITTVDGASFKSCAALEVIDLTGNNFDMINGQLFVNNPTLKAVYINRPPAMVLV